MYLQTIPPQPRTITLQPPQLPKPTQPEAGSPDQVILSQSPPVATSSLLRTALNTAAGTLIGGGMAAWMLSGVGLPLNLWTAPLIVGGAAWGCRLGYQNERDFLSNDGPDYGVNLFSD